MRELQNAIQCAVALAEFDHIGVEDLPEGIRDFVRGVGRRRLVEPPTTELVTAEEMERRYVLHVLEAVGGNKTRAAEVLGMDRRTIYRKLEAYAQPRPEPSQAPPGAPRAA